MLRFWLFHSLLRWMGGPVRFYGPPKQQQKDHYTKNQLLVFGQSVHATNIDESRRFDNLEIATAPLFNPGSRPQLDELCGCQEGSVADVERTE